MTGLSPWEKPLTWTREEIRCRAKKSGPVVTGLASLPAPERGPLIQQALEQVYTPTDHTIDIMQRLLAIGTNHARSSYSTPAAFVARAHSSEVDDSQMGGICLTGLAGIGKTSLIRALSRVVPRGIHVDVGSGLSPFPVRGMVHFPIKSALTAKNILCKLLEKLGNSNALGSLANLGTEARLKIYRQGASLLLADEMQKLTGSANANTKLTQAIYLLADLGIPLIYVANFSACHKLIKRPNEDKRRLFSDVILMRPEPAGSKDWEATVRGYLDVLPGLTAIDVQRDAGRLHDLSHGINYIAIKLLRLGCERAFAEGRATNIEDLEWVARDSERFQSERGDLERLRLQALTGRQVSSDLWCPFDQNVPLALAQQAKQQLQDEVANSMKISQSPKLTPVSRASKAPAQPSPNRVESIEDKRQKRLEEGMLRLAALGASTAPPREDP